MIVPATVAKVTYVGSARVTAGQSYKFEDCNIYKDIAKDDFAVIVKSDYTAKDEDTLTKADTVKGEVSGVKSGKIKVEGKWYTLATGVSAPEVGDTVQLAVVGSYAYDVDTTVGASKDILLISANKAAENDLNKDYTIEARAYFPDGSDKKITIDKLSMDAAKSADDIETAIEANALQNKMFTYSKDKDGNYELKTLNDSNNKAGYKNYANKAIFAENKETIGGYAIADDAIIFVKDSSGTKVMSGKTVKDWNKDFGTSGEVPRSTASSMLRLLHWSTTAQPSPMLPETLSTLTWSTTPIWGRLRTRIRTMHWSSPCSVRMVLLPCMTPMTTARLITTPWTASRRVS